jgi:hypothetical protein
VLLPIGKLIHQNLSTTFTNLDDLLSDIAEERVTGYIHLDSWEYDAYLLFDSGRLAQGFEYKYSEFLSGPEVINNVKVKVKEKDGMISVHQIEQETLYVLISMACRKKYLSDQLSNEKSLSELEDDLQKKELTCLTNIKFGDNFGKASIYLHDGIPVDCVIRSSSGKEISGIQLYEKIVDITNKFPSKYEVYVGDFIKATESLSVGE